AWPQCQSRDESCHTVEERRGTHAGNSLRCPVRVSVSDENRFRREGARERRKGSDSFGGGDSSGAPRPWIAGAGAERLRTYASRHPTRSRSPRTPRTTRRRTEAASTTTAAAVERSLEGSVFDLFDPAGPTTRRRRLRRGPRPTSAAARGHSQFDLWR